MWLALLTNKKFADTKGRSNKLTTTTMPAPKLAGKALYLELIPNPALSDDNKRKACGWEWDTITRQVIFFPEYQDDTGKIHTGVVFARDVSEHSPRAQWDWRRYSRCVKPITKEQLEEAVKSDYPYLYADDYSRDEFDSLSDEEKRVAKNATLTYALKELLLSRIRNEDRELEVVQAWVVRDDKPIVVEVTNQDRDDLESRKTPQAVVRRINKVRDSFASFPKKLPIKRGSAT